MKQQEPGFVRGIISGLRNVRDKAGRDHGEEVSRLRMKTITDVLINSYYDGLTDETVGELMQEVRTRYFQGHNRAFYYARVFKEQMEAQSYAKWSYSKGRPQVAIMKFVDILCDDLRMAAQIGKWAGESIEIAFWVAEQVHMIDCQASSRLLRACGKGLSGEEIDQFFWKLESQGFAMEWATRPFAQGMQEQRGMGTVKITAEYLQTHGRGPKSEPEAVEETTASSQEVRGPEVIKKEIDSVCYSTTEKEVLQRRADLLTELGNSIGSVDAKKWFEDRYPHLVRE